MNSPIKSILSIACVSFATLALAGCGGGDENGSSSTTNGGGGSSASGGSEASNEGPAYRVADEFISHMANGEYGEARALTDTGGSASVLDNYIQTLDTINQNPNASQLLAPIFDRVTQRFADAGIEVVEQTDDSATVRFTINGETYDATASTIDGESWTLSVPQGVLTPVEDLMGTMQIPQTP